MNKIVELLIDWDNIEFEELGVDIMSLVDKPAIGITWQAFSEQKFVEPTAGESESEFIGRCIPKLLDEGYDEDQAAAICYSYWKEQFNEKSLEPYTDECPTCNVLTKEEEESILRVAQSVGETIDIENAVFIDINKGEFSTITDYLKGVIGLDILGKRGLEQMEGETKYRYAGPPAQRNFCKAMQRMNKFYTGKEIREMQSRGINREFGHDNKAYSIFDFKGGVNCKHYWEEVELFKNGRQTVVIQKGRANGRAGQAASASNDYWRYNGSAQQFAFSDDDQRIVVGPAMIPDQLIPRKDQLGNTFHVFFSKDTIKKIAEKFFKEMKHNNTDVNHDDDITKQNTLLESWIVEDPNKDKSAVYGFNVPAGTWMTSYRINDQETWEQIKAGELNGFSVTGDFIQKTIK